VQEAINGGMSGKVPAAVEGEAAPAAPSKIILET
jgi:hypothetical protein